jgi:hypothetical protein
MSFFAMLMETKTLNNWMSCLVFVRAVPKVRHDHTIISSFNELNGYKVSVSSKILQSTNT